jgi:hypothetical protein
MPWMYPRAFSTGSRLLLDVGFEWGSASSSRRLQSSGRSHPQKVELPAWAESRCSVNSIAIADPSALNSNAGATVW